MRLRQTTKRQILIDVIRATPPEISRCRSSMCEKAIEWVTTIKNGRRMPVDHPLTVIRTFRRDDGATITSIDAATSHFATCLVAPDFRRPRWQGRV